jgi:hypothetical protein
MDQERRKEQRRKAAIRLGVERRKKLDESKATTQRGPDRRKADRRTGTDRRRESGNGNPPPSGSA